MRRRTDECNGGCIPEAPPDSKPLWVITAARPPGCGGAYGDEGPSGSAGLVAPAANCSSCTCDSTTNSCAAFVNLEANGNAMCGGGGVCSNTFNQACGELAVGCLDAAATMTRVQASVPANAGACSPSEQDPDIDPPASSPRPTWSNACAAKPKPSPKPIRRGSATRSSPNCARR